ARRSCHGTADRPAPPDHQVVPASPDAPQLPCRPSYRHREDEPPPRRDQETLRTASATGLSPPTSSSVWCRVPGVSSRAAMTAATSARGTLPPGTAGGASIGEAARTQDGPVQVPSAQIGLGGGLRRDVGRPDLVSAGPRRATGS